MLNIDISDFLQKHRLSDSYQTLAEQWYLPVLEEISMHHKSAKRTITVGINGAQGSGKSTLAQLAVYILREHYSLNVVSLSLDDFYFTRQERIQLGQGIHPLLTTRGVPGTHDIALARKTISQLINQQFPVNIPRFNKAEDDRAPAESEEIITQAVDVIIFEGWCLGAEAQDDRLLKAPINDLEEFEDDSQVWRRYVNEQLARFYPKLFELIDIWIMLKAPSFDCVYQWRLEQENKLKSSLSEQQTSTQIMDEKAVGRFIKYYQRITENTLNTLPNKVNYLFELDENRQITQLTQPLPTKLSSNAPHQWLVFTDMDGTLLDHHNYHFDEAIPTLAALEQNQIPVIPVTSKTAAEVELIRDSLGNHHPFIVENGAAVYIPEGYFDQQPEDTEKRGKYWVKSFVQPRQHWQSLIDQVRPAYQHEFKTFADAGIDGIIAMTGLNVHAAACAARREFGEPVSWHGNGNLKHQFITELTALGANILEGGRFIHVSGQCDKGQALAWLTAVYQQTQPQQIIQTLGIGDSQNDKAMLEQADYALLIRSPVHGLPDIDRTDNLTVSTFFGPKGWAEGVTQIIDAKQHSDSFNLPRGNHG
ncbi:HAD-IIB family hydrolase [Methylophaga sp.]|uniref:HAD-IIB family hydrolase n=1 Tax=Methylophaga sp. TaxID=2024840 RepID=UPI003A8F21AF